LPAGWDLALVEQATHALLDLVADGPHVGGVESGGVVEDPVLVAFAGEDRASVAAAHGDDHVGGAGDLVGPRFRVLTGDVDAAFGHRRDGGGVDLVAGFGAAGPGHRPVAGKVGEEPQRHLGAAGVVG